MSSPTATTTAGIPVSSTNCEENIDNTVDDGGDRIGDETLFHDYAKSNQTRDDSRKYENAGSTSSSFTSLSWEKARRILRDEVERYLYESDEDETSFPSCSGGNNAETIHSIGDTKEQADGCNTCSTGLLSQKCPQNADIFLAFAASTMLLILSCISFTTVKDLENHSIELKKSEIDRTLLTPTADKSVYVGQVIGGSLAVFSSLTSIVFVTARRKVSSVSRNAGTRRSLRNFLATIDSSPPTKIDERVRDLCGASLTGSGKSDKSESYNATRLTGTSLTDVYPVYRSTNGRGQWHLVPRLLLVRGDVVALQVGDVVPAMAEVLLGNDSLAEGLDVPLSVSGGDRVSFEHMEFGITGGRGTLARKSESFGGIFPRGRSTLAQESPDLLKLCNDMHLFVLTETALTSFLRSRKLVNHKRPQIHRQADSVRRFLVFLSAPTFVVTMALIFIRPGVQSADLTVLLPIPIIAALSTLPMFTPSVAILLEVVGTSRILVAAHPHVSRPLRGGSEGVGTKTQGAWSNCLFLRYCLATARSRLFPERGGGRCCIGNKTPKRQCSSDLVPVPPANAYLLEKLGVATALALIDDELACESQSTPQQLIIPSGHGLKLLDLCPNFDDVSEVDSHDNEAANCDSRKNTLTSMQSSMGSIDSEDSDDPEQRHEVAAVIGSKMAETLRSRWRKKAFGRKRVASTRSPIRSELKAWNEVLFEDPSWWEYIPSLKCIGLACLLVDESNYKAAGAGRTDCVTGAPVRTTGAEVSSLPEVKKSLVRHICEHQTRMQLLSLSHCIGFTTSANSHGERGDLSMFHECRRLHLIYTNLLRKRLCIDRHALGLEESRRWGHIHRDAVSVIVQDTRSKAFQVLTVGKPSVVAELCTDSWHGDTISPLSASERNAILDSSSNWNLSDLDVVAFSYAPVPFGLEQYLTGSAEVKGVSPASSLGAYLVDNRVQNDQGSGPSKEALSPDWLLVTNQIFLGMLGSLVSPRKEIDLILEQCSSAGVRFVYFSPRNMRRTKELASQMGIDVAWNCAISLRPLDEGQDDPHRMVSSYADWDVNARLPHGIEDVKRHLKEVDNVPLLVSLFTDVNEQSTTEMITVFREYHDTVVAVGLSHLSLNDGPFTAADLAIGVDVLIDETFEAGDLSNSEAVKNHIAANEPNWKNRQMIPFRMSANTVLREEVELVSSLASHSCVFQLKNTSSMSCIPDLVGTSRAALEGTTAAGLFVLNGCLSLAFLALLCPCTASSAIPFLPPLGSVLYLLVLLPLFGLSMVLTQADSQSMERVPCKNDESVVFVRDEGKRLFLYSVVRAFLPSICASLFYLVVFGELLVSLETSFMQKECSMPASGYKFMANWAYAIRCNALRQYTGVAWTSAGTLMFTEMVLCVIVSSSGFIFRTHSIFGEPPWKRNRAWVRCSVVGLIFLAIYLLFALQRGTFRNLPWYVFCLAIFMPFLCLAVGEFIKRYDRLSEKRASMLRRLQFETRLGMWSPK